MSPRYFASKALAQLSSRLRTTPSKQPVIHYYHRDRDAPLPDKICIFAHFDPENRVDETVLIALEGVKNELGYPIAFCSTSTALDEASLTKLKDLCYLVIRRENVGYDFGSWHTSLVELKKLGASFKEVLFFNDSIYGPFKGFSDISKKLSTNNSDAVGLLKSNEYIPHLQSYFMLWRERATQSKTFSKFLNNYQYNLSKKELILLWEVGLFQSLTKEKCSFSGLYNDTSHQKTNPSIDTGLSLIRDRNFPFIKRQLIIENPRNSQGNDSWSELVRLADEQFANLIQSHTKRQIDASAHR